MTNNSPQIPFVKLHANGNDFVLIDCLSYPIHHLFSGDAIGTLAAMAPQLSDRKTGIGFDQMLIVSGGFHPSADFGCTVINADGSYAGNCMNGSRAIAFYLWREKLNAGECVLSFKTIDIKLSIANHTAPSNTIEVLSAVMGKVNFLAYQDFSDSSKSQLQSILPAQYGQILGLVDLGNHHLVIQTDSQDDHLMVLAKQLQDGTTYSFKTLENGVNVLFFRLPADNSGSDELQCRVYERGVGETRACGSAAAATAVALYNHYGEDMLPCTLRLAGGKLQIGLTESLFPWVKADASWVYSGTFNLS